MDYIGTRKVTEVDYKADSSDILFALQEAFGKEIPMLSSENMTSLAENYAMEQTLDILKAFGQEITLADHLLYMISEDSDAYLLTLIASGQAEDFEQEMKALQRKVTLLLQPRKKPGSKAKRIDLGKRLLCKSYPLPDGLRFCYHPPVVGLYLADNAYANCDHIKSCLIALDPEPHILHNIPKWVHCLTGTPGHYAAIWQNPECDVNHHLLDRTYYLSVGRSLTNFADWKVIYQEESRDPYDICYWYGEDLFLANNFHVAVLSQAMSGNFSPEILLESNRQALTFSKFFELKGELYLYLQGTFYRYRKGGLFQKAGFTVPIYTIRTKTIKDFTIVGAEEVAFIEQNYSRPRSRDIQMMQVTILNVVTGNARYLSCPAGNLTSIESGKILDLCIDHDIITDKKALPILLGIDLNSNERTEIPFGSLGAQELLDVYKTSQERIVLRGYGQRLYYPSSSDFSL